MTILFTFLWKILGVSIMKGSRAGVGVFLGNRKSIHLKEQVTIGLAFHISASPDGSLTIGEGTRINRFFTCGAQDSVVIGNDCLFSYGVSIQSGNHSFGKEEIPGVGSDTTAPINIGNRCFIGCGAVILKGVTLGNNCVVGANSVVKESFPSGSVISGNPAILLKTL